MPTKPDCIYLESSALLTLNTDLRDPKFQNFLRYAQALEVPLRTTALAVAEFVWERYRALTIKVSEVQRAAGDAGRFLGESVQIELPGPPEDFRKRILEAFVRGLEEAHVEVVENATPVLAELLDRAAEHVQPFAANDKGFKDTLIFLTILSDASRRNARTLLLVATDGDFHAQEIRDEARAAAIDLVVVRTIDDAVAHLKQVLAEDTRREIDEEIARLKTFLLSEKETILSAIRKERFDEWELTKGSGVFRIHQVLDSEVDDIEGVIPEMLLEEVSTGRVPLEFVAKLRVLVLGEPLRLPMPSSGTLNLEAGAQPDAGAALFARFLAGTPEAEQVMLEPRFYVRGSAHYDADTRQYSNLQIDLVRPSAFAGAIARRLKKLEQG